MQTKPQPISPFSAQLAKISKLNSSELPRR